jgi:DNA-binding GntR family transcriptional regulator
MILKALVAHPGISEAALGKEINRDEEMVREALRQLRAERFIVKKGRRLTINE